MIRAHDLERAHHFYATLGLSFHRHRHGSGPEHLTCEADDFVFEIYPHRGLESTGTRLGFLVPDVDACVDALRQHGYDVPTPARDSPWGRRAVATDPDGHRVEITQELNAPR